MLSPKKLDEKIIDTPHKTYSHSKLARLFMINGLIH